MQWNEVLHFWFGECEPKDWFTKSDAFDAMVRERFLATYESAVAGELDEWRSAPEGRLAEVIVLDQFSRNMFRDDPRAFAADPLALCLAQWAVAAGDDQKIEKERRSFLYMPYMHSESPIVHEVAVELFREFPKNYDYELRHKAIIDRFGRYPHRNRVLGRESTEEELAFLKEPGSSF